MERPTQSGKAPIAIRPTCVLATIPVSQGNTIHPHVTSHVTVSALPTVSAVCLCLAIVSNMDFFAFRNTHTM